VTRLSDYQPIVGRGAIEELEILADQIAGRKIQNINSTYTGGGVAEILSRLVPLLSELGVSIGWDVVGGDARFFEVTKKLHNALHGRGDSLTRDEIAVYMATSDRHLRETAITGDLVVVHDPQPCGLVRRRDEDGRRWVWRCHIDLSSPQPEAWELLRPLVERYHCAIFSAPQFARSLPIRQLLVSPSIDPLSDKNRELPPETIRATLDRHGIPGDLPLITQISRFDRLKDPVGVIAAFELVRRSFPCRLVLAGGTATDDPESAEVLAEVQERASGNPFIHVLLLPPRSDLDVNALQRASTVVVQKSLREGFALTVSEALWKEKPVVATAVGGIPLQVKNGITGLLSHGIAGTARDLRQLLANPDYARHLGRNGREHVRQNFLVTRHMRDYLLLAIALSRPGDLIHLGR
jgi:trehalose synthase